MTKLIEPNGHTTVITPTGSKKVFSLEELQAYVGGYIQIIKAPKGFRFVVNEDGIPLRLPPNPVATALLQSYPTVTLVGNVVVGTKKELGI